MGADTEADIYLNVFGERGDWGKRYLRQSNNSKKYRTGQVSKRHCVNKIELPFTTDRKLGASCSKLC